MEHQEQIVNYPTAPVAIPNEDVLFIARPLIDRAAIVLAGAGLDKLTIANDVEATDRKTKLAQIDGTARELDAARKELVAPYNQRVKIINDAFRSPIDRLKEASVKYSGAILAYQRKKETEARTAAEKLRLEQEAAKRKEEERIRAEAAKQAAKLEKKGNEEAAAEVRARAAEAIAEVEAVPVTVIAPAATKSTRTESGTVFTKKETEVVVSDVKALLAAVVAGTIPVGVVEIKVAELKRLAKMGQALPGCEVREVEKIQTRGGR